MRVTETWRLKDNRYQLKVTAENPQGEMSFPPRPVTPREVETYNFSHPTAEYVWKTEQHYVAAER